MGTLFTAVTAAAAAAAAVTAAAVTVTIGYTRLQLKEQQLL